MIRYEYIFLDLDGTVSDSALGILSSVKYALKKTGATIPPEADLMGFIGPPLSVGFKEICGMTEAEAELCVKYYREYYRSGGIFECSIYDGVEETLKMLFEMGKKIVLATSKPEEFAIKILEHFGLSKYFHTVCGASFDNSRSDKSAVIEYALNSCGVKDKSKVIMVGDRHHDIDGAKENGIDSVGVLYGFGDIQELQKAEADFIISSLKLLIPIVL